MIKFAEIEKRNHMLDLVVNEHHLCAAILSTKMVNYCQKKVSFTHTSFVFIARRASTFIFDPILDIVPRGSAVLLNHVINITQIIRKS